jgi:hypothetical protein
MLTWHLGSTYIIISPYVMYVQYSKFGALKLAIEAEAAIHTRPRPLTMNISNSETKVATWRL